MKALGYLTIIVPLLAVLSLHGQGGSESERLLKDYLAANPRADYDSDGVLTRREAGKYERMQTFIAKQTVLLETMPKPQLAEYSYGPHWRHTLDFWRAEAAHPTPVLLFFHPGGFVGGDKSLYYGNPLVRACLENGISVVLANYRYAMQAPFPRSHLDAARVVQTIRHHADSWGIDPTKVAMTGASAGGNMSVWLAVHDDLADPDSDDPVSRQSTRLTTIIGVNSQTSNDPFFIWDHIYLGTDAHSSIFPFYGIEEMGVDRLKKVMNQPEYRQTAHEASSINHISRDDPPVFLIHPERLADWDGQPLPADTPQSKYAHHIAFGKHFKDRYDALGLTCKLKGKEETTVDEQIAWLKRWFGMR